MTTICYHRGCPDGFTAAWLIQDWVVNVLNGPTPRMVDAMYGDEPPHIEPGEPVFVVDFCYEPAQLEPLKQHAGQFVILDHHETSRQWMLDAIGAGAVHTSVAGVRPNKVANLYVSDFGHSGAGLAAWYTDTEGAYPFVDYVQDRDLWRWALNGTAEAFAAITSRPYTIDAWNELASLSRDELLSEGQAINRYREQIIAATIDTAHQSTVLGHDDIWVAASPYAIGSDVAGRLAARDPDRFAAYYVDYGHRVRWGLRSLDSGLNVAELAATVGGGGHAHAAGFEVPRGRAA